MDRVESLAQDEKVKNRARIVVNALERSKQGGDRDPDIWFFRGTSVEDLERAIATGTFAGQAESDALGNKGDAWAAIVGTRVKSQFVNSRRRDNKPTGVSEASEEASFYGEHRAFIHNVRTKLGYGIDVPIGVHQFICEFATGDSSSYERSLERLLSSHDQRDPKETKQAARHMVKKFGKKGIIILITEVQKENRKGVILGIHKSVLDRATALGFEDEGSRIGVGPKGLRIEDIVTIEAPGEDRRQFMANLKARFSLS